MTTHTRDLPRIIYHREIYYVIWTISFSIISFLIITFHRIQVLRHQTKKNHNGIVFDNIKIRTTTSHHFASSFLKSHSLPYKNQYFKLTIYIINLRVDCAKKKMTSPKSLWKLLFQCPYCEQWLRDEPVPKVTYFKKMSRKSHINHWKPNQIITRPNIETFILGLEM